MRISAVYNNYSFPKRDIKTSAKQNTSFGAIKGLGDKAEDLLNFINKEVKEVFAKNSSLNTEWDNVYQRYLNAVHNNASENEVRSIVKELQIYASERNLRHWISSEGVLQCQTESNSITFQTQMTST